MYVTASVTTPPAALCPVTVKIANCVGVVALNTFKTPPGRLCSQAVTVVPAASTSFT
jgi:hypothetical protein